MAANICKKIPRGVRKERRGYTISYRKLNLQANMQKSKVFSKMRATF